MPLAIPLLRARRTPLAIALWVLTVLLALFFTMGMPKVLGQGGWGHEVRRVGLSPMIRCGRWRRWV
jgi:hypothetical protein